MSEKEIKEITAEEVLKQYEGAKDGKPQDEGDNLIKLDEEKEA